MKGFRFRLARILEWRRLQADQARAAFLRASESARETAAALSRAEAGETRAVQEYLGVMSTPVDVATLERYRNWIGRQRAHVISSHKAHEQRRAIVDKTAAALQIANRHVKVMERLRERAEKRYRESERQLEMKAIDELATLRHARRHTEEGAERD
jgi:flagellar export protein FliJ